MKCYNCYRYLCKILWFWTVAPAESEHSPCADMPNIPGKIFSLKIKGHYQLYKTELSSNTQTYTFVLVGELWKTYY